jgi:hypothetical protein
MCLWREEHVGASRSNQLQQGGVDELLLPGLVALPGGLYLKRICRRVAQPQGIRGPGWKR